MKPIAAEWVRKAEGDFATTTREARARKDPNYDAACYHAQQCAEKYLKARLVEADVRFQRTHDLLVLLDLIADLEPAWELLRDDLAHLSAYAVEVRYPGESANRQSAKDSLVRCNRFRTAARTALGLPV